MGDGQTIQRDDRRQYIRVPTDCPVTFRVLDPEQPEVAPGHGRYLWDQLPAVLSAEQLSKTKGIDQSRDAPVIELLLWLDWKVSFLIKALAEQQGQGALPCRGTLTEISASGMRIVTETELQTGAVIECDLVLPVIPFQSLLLKASVVQCRKRTTGKGPDVFEAGFAFRDISETAREILIKFVLKREMQIQRERRSA